MSQMTVKANENNDLKYRQGLFNPNDKKKKDQNDFNNISEGGNQDIEQLEYFTE